MMNKLLYLRLLPAFLLLFLHMFSTLHFSRFYDVSICDFPFPFFSSRSAVVCGLQQICKSMVPVYTNVRCPRQVLTCSSVYTSCKLRVVKNGKVESDFGVLKHFLWNRFIFTSCFLWDRGRTVLYRRNQH